LKISLKNGISVLFDHTMIVTFVSFMKSDLKVLGALTRRELRTHTWTP
jgi:hypothetical protein